MVPKMTAAEYLEIERKAAFKSEFVRGKLEAQRLIKMSGDICAGMYYLANMGFVVSTHLIP